ncbi:unnamed protein product [Clavelina lepadiformis]|uniref:Cysteine-rich DPF motif domain-containing protein 1 n=1 Tax=Clavelina lepadiformis TaxID=159417 RepID=A0ABP0G4H3_CLALP
MDPKKFKCSSCGLTADYNHFGQTPLKTAKKNIVLLEKAYTMRNPFKSNDGEFLVVGAHCSICGDVVCVDPDCSLFYSKRFCLNCASNNINEFPLPIQKEILHNCKSR